ncbi:unnamed protein product [Lasius platythorax]|uniref:Uncharacterized protein n=1 Tax=Lasius platythorax TaxID=488582 RepID=A0AAV2N0Q9_9HYME
MPIHGKRKQQGINKETGAIELRGDCRLNERDVAVRAIGDPRPADWTVFYYTTAPERSTRSRRKFPLSSDGVRDAEERISRGGGENGYKRQSPASNPSGRSAGG